MSLRRSLIATGMVAALAVAGVTAAVADDPPPRVAFLANGIVPADALAAGPIAGQLGAPIYTTAPGHLIDSTGAALDAYDPDLVIVMGGPAAIADAVLAQVADATGLTVKDASPPPAHGIVRAAGQDRFQTAAAAAALLGSYDPAFLPTDMKAVDSDKLDGKDASDFQPAGDYLGKTAKAADADTLDGKDSTDFQPAGDYVEAGGSHTISLPAGGLNVDPTDPITQPGDHGLLWEANYRASAMWALEPPANWDGKDVTLELFFHPTTGSGGIVDWFIRPQSPALGDTLGDIADINGPGVAAGGDNTFQSQTFTIPADRLTGGDMWQIVMQRQGDEASYPDPVRLRMVTLTYGTQ